MRDLSLLPECKIKYSFYDGVIMGKRLDFAKNAMKGLLFLHLLTVLRFH